SGRNTQGQLSRTWSLRYMVAGKARQMGLGTWPEVSLAEARRKALDGRRLAREGVDPIEARQAKNAAQRISDGRATATFEKVAGEFVTVHKPSWKNAKHGAQWESTLRQYCYPQLGSLPVADIEAAHVLGVLKPIWIQKPETASRLRGRIEAILDYAAAHGWRTRDNPARWKGGLEYALPSKGKIAPVKHHDSLPYQELPEFMAKLRSTSGFGAMALEFAILTATRSGETRRATWQEIDLGARVWTIPKERMKSGREHRVPLSDVAVSVLKRAADVRLCDLVFPGRKGRQLSDMTMTGMLRRFGTEVTAHGFRATFKTWASDKTEHSREVIEASLAHVIGDRAEQAYQRGSWFERRRALMADWAAYCAGSGSA
ncbi:MAG: tyrosine-type recombinase/integrase, partial [Acetobacteraceae bacterium]|nr:tyrosine-type recombinase/integrase [Acetobacteraceae bacterium]